MLQAPVQLYKNAYTGIPRPAWWLALVMFVNRSGTMVIPFLTVYLTHEGYSLREAGYVMGAFGLGSIVGGYLGGRLTDRFGSFYIQFFSLFINGIFFIVLGQMHSLWQYALCIFLLSSLGEAFRPANAAAIAAYSNDSNRIRCYSLNRLAINLGWSIGPAVGGVLASISYSYLFWADGLTCMAASFLLFAGLSPSKQPKPEKAKSRKNESTTTAYKDKPFLQGMFYLFLVGLVFFQLFSVLPAYYKTELNLNEATIGWILAMNGLLIAAIEMVLVYKLENRRSSLLYIMTGSLLMGAAFLALGAGKTTTIAVASMIIVTFGEMFLFPFLNNFWVKRSTESNRGQYAALYTMSFAAATVLAPTLATQLAAWLGFSILWVVDFFLCTFAAVGFYFLKRSLA
ncbi:MDR family MFS transporter [Flavisolibacter nicotianae]|uniref:MDR family MFS transporter n=1 Tax=Flavisolibacter nicotianae TaxID=2364882 RepID=UPI000EB2D810|nr:MFS transporter [Flavisolibacter nicotianae]